MQEKIYPQEAEQYFAFFRQQVASAYNVAQIENIPLLPDPVKVQENVHMLNDKISQVPAAFDAEHITLTYPPVIPAGYEVFTDNSHAYLALMQAAQEKIDTAENRPVQHLYETWVKQAFMHEMAHAVRGLGNPELHIHYGIRFGRNAYHEVDFVPFVAYSGTFSLRTYQAMVNGPDNPSSLDIIQQQIGHTRRK